jgi:DNA-binding protein
MEATKLMEKQKKIRAPPVTLPDNIIRMNRHSHPQVYLDQVIKLFTEGKEEEVTLSAIGTAIPKVLIVAEAARHRIAGLHQVSCIVC